MSFPPPYYPKQNLAASNNGSRTITPPPPPPIIQQGGGTNSTFSPPPQLLSQQSGEMMPPFVDRSPKIPSTMQNVTANNFGIGGSSAFSSSSNGTAAGNSSGEVNSAQRYLQQNRDRKLFDSADYYSNAPPRRNEVTESGFGNFTDSVGSANVLPRTASAFDQVSYEANRLHGQEPRHSALSFEMFNQVADDDMASVNSSGDDAVQRKHSKDHSMRRASMEEFFVEENHSETVKHAILEKPKLKRWDSGDFYSSPSEYRQMLATQAKEVLKQALDHADEEHRPRRHRRSSLSMSETHED
jgi:hypothetical protein